MTEVSLSVEVHNRRVRCNQVSDAIVSHIGALVFFNGGGGGVFF